MSAATRILGPGGAPRPRRRAKAPSASSVADRLVGIALAGAVLALGFVMCAFVA